MDEPNTLFITKWTFKGEKNVDLCNAAREDIMRFARFGSGAGRGFNIGHSKTPRAKRRFKPLDRVIEEIEEGAGLVNDASASPHVLWAGYYWQTGQQKVERPD